MNIVETEKIKKILIMQLKPFGDVLLTTAYFQELSKRFPAAKIDFLVKKPYHQILDHNPYINKLLLAENVKGIAYTLDRIKIIKKVRKEHYDLIIDQQNGTGTGQISFFSGAKYRIGYADGKWRFAHNVHAQRGPLRYSGSRKFDILSPLGITEVKYELFFHVKAESKHKIKTWFQEVNIAKDNTIVFSPGSPVKRKKWDKKCYAILADKILQNTDYNVVFLWAPKELEDVKEIMSLMKEKAILALPTSFNECAAFIADCKALVCNDGGVNHLAVATKTPTLAIFGNTSPHVWSPASVFKTHHHLYNEEFDSSDDATFGIDPNEAYQELIKILQNDKIIQSSDIIDL